jgi:ATP-binding cassette subfamily B protein
MDTVADGRGLGPVEAVQRTGEVAEGRRRVRLGSLMSLIPYVLRYRVHVVIALLALLVAASATLVVPIAVRRLIDYGFAADRVGLVDRYFTAMIAVAAVLAGASAVRYYTVTVLGERVVADLRTALFAHVTTLSASFFDTAKSGEVLSRLTADTTQIKATVGASVSVPGGESDDGHHQRPTVRIRAGGDPDHRFAAGGVRARGAAAIAPGPG